ncbi:MAG TPA: IS630 family transposase [Pseudolabrys sp.]
MALSDDLRERVIGAVVDGGMSRNAAAKHFGVSIASAVRWVARFKTKGEISPAPTGGDRRSHRIEAHRDYLLGLIRRQPDMTLLEIQERLIANCGERFSSSVIWRFFDRHEITFKKTAHAEEQGRSDVLTQRRAWFAGQLDLDPTKLVFIDETWASTNMARKRGRCRRGRRLRAAIPHGHYKTVTLVAGLRLSGLVAQKAFDRPINAASFEQWVEKSLAPTLAKGDIVVMDNLSSHKGPKVEQLIKAVGAELRYLPPYSPDMNPIEKVYSKLKAFLRKIAERTVAGLMAALEACADIFKPTECANYFQACGYDTG